MRFKYEASYFDRIKMTKNWLECDRKTTNMNVGTCPKDYIDEHERLNMTWGVAALFLPVGLTKGGPGFFVPSNLGA